MEFGVLGPLEVRRGDEIVRLRGAKQRALLASLLLDANRVVPAERLIDNLWGERPPESGDHALRVRVSELRKTLETEGAPGTITTRAPGYVMNVRRNQLDLFRFEDGLQRGATALADEDFAAASHELREALDLWRGPALADVVGEDFGRSEAMRLEELRLHALELCIEAELALGKHEELVSELQYLVEDHPLNERLRAQLMRALYATGRQSEALDAYRSGRKQLVTELGIEPSPTLQALGRDILRHDPALEATGPSAAPAPRVDKPPSRSLLVLPSSEEAVDNLLALSEPMARTPPHELILMRLVGQDDELTSIAASLHDRREQLVADGLSARAAAFATVNPGADAVQVAHEQTVDLILADLELSPDGGGKLASDSVTLLERAPCDVALLQDRSENIKLTQRPVVVPFGAADHDWAAGQLATWIVKAHDSRLQLAGVGKGSAGQGRDASRLLARASLLLQKTLGITAEPLVVDEGAEALVEAVAEAGLVVAGLASLEERRELGSVRLSLVESAAPPVLLVREGLRPSALAPTESLTRYTWSMTIADG